MEFHLESAGVEEPSVPEAEVRRRIADGQLRETDICWTEGWEAWKPLGDVFPDDFPAPATSPESMIAPPAEISIGGTRALPRRRDRTSSAIFATAALVAVLLAVGGFLWFQLREEPGPDSAKPKYTGPKTSAEFIGTHLEQVAQACLAYAATHAGKLPSYSAQLEPLFGTRFEIVMDVPETPQIEKTGYVLRLGLDTSMPPDTPIAFEARARADGSRGVAYLNGRVRVFQRGDPRLAEALGP